MERKGIESHKCLRKRGISGKDQGNISRKETKRGQRSWVSQKKHVKSYCDC